ncbi:hypothetical protein F5B21DRAFT_301660 [Xylaria acuta]|nr:hypothetical protein F5B21DRAFT_301660 [Xylaria acuta]
MFFDTGLNSAPTMLNNIHRAFMETATKMWAYARCLPAPKQPPPKIIISTPTASSIPRPKTPQVRFLTSCVETIGKLTDTAYLLLVSRTRKLRYPGYVCDVKKCEVSWLAYGAFHQVLGRKQSKYGEVLAWLKAESVKLSLLKDIRHGRVQTIV